ncbi:MAG: TniB family NTP-binding protein [Clostridia bacterium]|nr:TniB family NTP-binding protein [Clostridia bacterium]
MNKSKEFAERVARLNIQHPKVVRICNMLDSIRANRNMGDGKNSPRHSYIIGGSGVGKTIMVKGYEARNPGYTRIDEDGREIDIKPVVYVELPNPFTIQEFYQAIISGLEAPQLPGKPTTGELKRQVLKLIKDQGVEMLILDEMDYILSSRHVKTLEAMDTIKHIGNKANISLVCVGTPEAGKLRTLNDQYFRRFTPIYLERFIDCDEEFCSFLNEVEAQLDPWEPIGLGNMNTRLPQLLHRMCKGIVGFLTPTIQEAYRMLGVFDSNFNDYTKIKLKAEVLFEAYSTIVGDLTEEELEKIIMLQDEKTKKT